MDTQKESNIEDCGNFYEIKPRKCVRSEIVKIISMCVFAAIILSIIYHAIVLERLDRLRQAGSFGEASLDDDDDLKIDRNPSDNEAKTHIYRSFHRKLNVEQIITLDSVIERNPNLNEDELKSVDKTKPLRTMHLRRRLPRGLSFDTLDVTQLARNEPDFEQLYAKVRSKREQLALSKLQNEYERCKEEAANGRECMLAFVKMYNIAKEISDKMEKMKAIFKDSERLLQQQSLSEESTESNLAAANEVESDMTNSDESIHVKEHGTVLSCLESTTATPIETTTEESTTTTMATTPRETTAESCTLTKAATITTSTTATTIETTTASLKACSLSTTEASTPVTGNFNDSMLSAKNLEANDFLNVDSDEELSFSQTTEAAKSRLLKELASSAGDIECDEARLRKLKFDWILDDEEVTPDEGKKNHSQKMDLEETTAPPIQSTTIKSIPAFDSNLHLSHSSPVCDQNQPMNADFQLNYDHPYDFSRWEEQMRQEGGLLGRGDLINTFADLHTETQAKTDQQRVPVVGSRQPTLCEHIPKNNRHMNDDGSQSKLQPKSNCGNQTLLSATRSHSRAPAVFPVTGETVKASAQFMLNPNFAMPTVPVCFYAVPTAYRPPTPAPTFFNVPANFGGSSSGLMSGAGGIFFVPQSIGTAGNFGGLMSGSMGGVGPQFNIPNNFATSAAPQKQQQSFCTYLQNKNTGHAPVQQGNFYSGPGSGVSFPNANFKLRSFNQTPSADIVYASYDGRPPLLGQAQDAACDLSYQTACYAGGECVRSDKWCDGRVDCTDGSDEAACTCRNRLPQHRICDGYSDCPMGEDEIGCFGCQELSFSCYENAKQFERFNRSLVSMCYSSMEKCDGFVNCLNGRDEQDCSVIVSDVTNRMWQPVSASEGFLYRNHRGEWFPVCSHAQKWAKEACENEGAFAGAPSVEYQPLSLPGPFIEPSQLGSVQFAQSCRMGHYQLMDHVPFVRCAPAKCGVQRRRATPWPKHRSKRFTKPLLAVSEVGVSKDDERIVGGRQSEPEKWPFVVALYRNGDFHCGGTIYSERWIISAAHCVKNYQKYYYEVRAGILRLSSYAASTQFRPVSHVIVHRAYDPDSLRNDLCLLRLAAPLKLNRWVKPICMPDVGRTTLGEDWVWGPEENTLCYTMGWGAIREKGPASNYLREAILPIKGRCTQLADQKSESICAGEFGGGRDACQGDSGGPLFCPSVGNSNEWYLAGVVSHGNGCGRPGELGVYTRIALFLDWIEVAVRSENLPQKQPLAACPGHVCVWGGQHCIPQEKRCDRIVDCLGGEDEVGCARHFVPDLGSVPKSHVEIEKDDFMTSTKMVDIADDRAIFSNQHLRKKLPLGVTAAPPIPRAELTETTLSPTTEFMESTTPMTTIKPKFKIKTTQPSVMLLTTSKATEKEIDKRFTEAASIASNAATTVSPATITRGNASHSHHYAKVHAKNNAKHQSPYHGLAQKIQHKFVCQKIPQIIELHHRCDRLIDCEDGTDEENCRCRDYLKDALSVLICDGKTDCDDFTDEVGCGNCSASEFHCPRSKTCLPLRSRCDNSPDCKFKEDEMNCLALSNGKNASTYALGQTSLNNVGVLSRNKHGIWHIVCFPEANFKRKGAQTASEMCSLLGFEGYKLYKATHLDANEAVPIDTNYPDVAYVNEEILGSEMRRRFIGTKARRAYNKPPKECVGLFLECQEKLKTTLPLRTISAGEEITLPPSTDSLHGFKPMMTPHGTPKVLTNSNPSMLKQETVEKLKKVLEQRGKLAVQVHNQIHEALEEIHWPWLADIYVNGRLWCIGVLLDKRWVMVHESCRFGIRFGDDYVAALFGGGKSKNKLHKSPHEQIRRVDCFDVVANSNVLLFHLDKAVGFTRYILPSFLPDVSQVQKNVTQKCVAVAHDDVTGRAKAMAITEHANTSSCSNGADDLVCYQLMESNLRQMQSSESASSEMSSHSTEDEYPMLSHSVECHRFGSPKSNHDMMHPVDQGILVCRGKDTGWYPKAMFSYNNTDCSSFKQTFGIKILPHAYRDIEKHIEKAKCSFAHEAPDCSSYRCPLGECLGAEQVCDHRSDCHDGSDENLTMCRRRKSVCKSYEMKCRSSNKCIPKTKFCDHIPDCEDLTDEPTVCSCFTYLQAVEPEKICDGIRNCWDKSDESRALCNCTSTRFPCGRDSDDCIPHEFVCDKEIDCPRGEDEAYCYGVEQPIIKASSEWEHSPQSTPSQYGQVIEQSYGVWHTKCFPRNSPPSDAEVRMICRKLGYTPYRQPRYRLIDDFSDAVVDTQVGLNRRGHGFTNENLAGKYRPSTKVKVATRFSPLYLNDRLTLFLKPSRPIAELVRWNVTDSSHCFRLEIKCG